jgi:hypothetical protein
MLATATQAEAATHQEDNPKAESTRWRLDNIAEEATSHGRQTGAGELDTDTSSISLYADRMTLINRRFIADARHQFGQVAQALADARPAQYEDVRAEDLADAIDKMQIMILDLIEWADQVTKHLESSGVRIDDSPVH